MKKNILILLLFIFTLGKSFSYFFYNLNKPNYNPAVLVLTAKGQFYNNLTFSLGQILNSGGKKKVIEVGKNMSDNEAIDCIHGPINGWTEDLMKKYSSCYVNNFVKLALETELKRIKKYCQTTKDGCKDFGVDDNRLPICIAFDKLTSRGCHEGYNLENWDGSEPYRISSWSVQELKKIYDLNYKFYKLILQKLFPLDKDKQVEKLNKIISILNRYTQVYREKINTEPVYKVYKVMEGYLILKTLTDSLKLYYYKLTGGDNFEEIQQINQEIKSKTIDKKYDFNTIFVMIKNIFRKNYKCGDIKKYFPINVSYNNENFSNDDFYPFTKQQFLDFFKMQLSYYICFIKQQSNNTKLVNYLVNNVNYEITKTIPFSNTNISFKGIKTENIIGMMQGTKTMYLRYDNSKLFRAELVFLYLTNSEKSKKKLFNNYVKYSSLTSTFLHELSHFFQFYNILSKRQNILNNFYSLCWITPEKQNGKCNKDDFVRRYGMVNQNEDWATIGEKILIDKFRGIKSRGDTKILKLKISYYEQFLSTYKK